MTPSQLAAKTPAFRLGYWHGYIGRPPVQTTHDERADYLRGWTVGAFNYRYGRR